MANLGREFRIGRACQLAEAIERSDALPKAVTSYGMKWAISVYLARFHTGSSGLSLGVEVGSYST